MSAVTLLTAGCTAGEHDGAEAGPGDPRGALGANFNEDADSVTFDELRGLSASWLRGFVPMPEVTDDVSEQRAVKMLLEAHHRRYGTVLSLKFPYGGRPVPRPGGPAMTAELARVDKVLHAVLDRVDVLVIGNEPFIESRSGDHSSGAMNAFYEHAAAHVIARRKKLFPSGCRTRLYMGALNRLDRPENRTAATARWLSFTRKTPQLEGVDIHPHVAAPEDVQPFLDYVLPRLRGDQTFLVTEFSLVHLWKQHMRDVVPAAYARRHRLPPDTPVWKVISGAIEHPLPEGQWHEFLSLNPWFEHHKHFLRHQVDRFRDTGRLAVAAYGVSQGEAMARNFGPDKTPWLLNSLYANRVAKRSHGDLPARGYGGFDDFRALQRTQDRRPVRTARVTG